MPAAHATISARARARSLTRPRCRSPPTPQITSRIKKLAWGLNAEHCDPVVVAQKVAAGVYSGVTTSELDELAAETAASMTAKHPDYALYVPRAREARRALAREHPARRSSLARARHSGALFGARI